MPLVHSALIFAAIFVGSFLLHLPLLRLPYFWDEAGYYVPAARDLLIHGNLIPHTTVSNAHPPLVLAWLALWWKVVGYAPVVTRAAMLLVSSFSLFGLFRLAERVANIKVAVASTICTGLYPVFFAQSSLAQVDLAAAGLTFWALADYLEENANRAALWFCLAVLAKETAILVPLSLCIWELTGTLFLVKGDRTRGNSRSKLARVFPFFVPAMVLAGWYAFHYSQTGYVFGNPEFFRYNVASTLSPLRFVLALVLRLWQTFGYMHLWLLTMGMLLAMLLPPVKDDLVERSRIPIPTQAAFLVIVGAYVVVLALIGGAVLARYMLTAVPLVIVLAVSTLYRRLRSWGVAVTVIAIAFVTAWFWNPPYGFSPEDNLAYRDYVVLHENAEQFLEARYPMARVLTAWPASDELTRPWLGYITRPVQVVRIEDFSLEQILSATEFRDRFEIALVFSTKYEPRNPLLERWTQWTDWKRRFFGFHRDLPPSAATRVLGGKIIFSEERAGQWIAVMEMDRSEWINARKQGPAAANQLVASDGKNGF
ncbi:MAG TPA: glycosyltransferase family 39 protein [Candidatus Sulfotelmatobacter sp.]|nr:glycosyltransferase family 39 protein [Candidatus Sulfotelmatobacter sp.]